MRRYWKTICGQLLHGIFLKRTISSKITTLQFIEP